MSLTDDDYEPTDEDFDQGDEDWGDWDSWLDEFFDEEYDRDMEDTDF